MHDIHSFVNDNSLKMLSEHICILVIKEMIMFHNRAQTPIF